MQNTENGFFTYFKTLWSQNGNSLVKSTTQSVLTKGAQEMGLDVGKSVSEPSGAGMSGAKQK